MNRLATAWVLALSTLSGCIGGTVVERSYFSLGYPKAIVEREVAPHDATILVRRFSAEPAYDKYEVIYRESPYAFGYYRYKLWASKPKKMLGQLVTSHLRNAALVTDVLDRLVDQNPTYELEGEVIAIEEVNRSETEWLARLALRLTLYPYGKRRPLWVWEFDVQRPVPERSPLLVVKALSEILETQLDLAFADLDGRLGALASGVTAPPKPPRPTATQPAAQPKAPPEEPEIKRVR